jgi:hypothetical protein
LAASLANILSNGKNSTKKGKMLSKVTYISCHNGCTVFEAPLTARFVFGVLCLLLVVAERG